ncbi:MAG: CDP-alcohol phosphatidyltransferase family protein [Lentimicrobium sp.]|nr:CDP-alcohol phosphatidyltransferase family protein [Lentimicrobium sp.]
MNKLPLTLIYSRLAIGIAIIFLSALKIENYKLIAIILFTIGLLTDIFDGIIARRLNISTQKLRRLDSTIDQVSLFLLPLRPTSNVRSFLKQIL